MSQPMQTTNAITYGHEFTVPVQDTSEVLRLPMPAQERLRRVDAGVAGLQAALLRQKQALQLSQTANAQVAEHQASRDRMRNGYGIVASAQLVERPHLAPSPLQAADRLAIADAMGQFNGIALHEPYGVRPTDWLDVVVQDTQSNQEAAPLYGSMQKTVDLDLAYEDLDSSALFGSGDTSTEGIINVPRKPAEAPALAVTSDVEAALEKQQRMGEEAQARLRTIFGEEYGLAA